MTLDSSFESLGIDSLDRLNILFDLESEFDIEINDEDAKRVENIPQMIAGVLTLVEAKAQTAETPVAGAPQMPEMSQEKPAPQPDSPTKPASSGE